MNIFTLQVIGSSVVYSGTSGEYTFVSLVKAYRYLRRWKAVKVAGDKKALTGAYIIEGE